METQNILKELREKHGLTQEQLAERVMVTRQPPPPARGKPCPLAR